MSPAELLGILFVAFAFLLFLLEIKAPGLGALGIGGVASLVVGLLFIFGFSWASVPLLVAVALPALLLVLFLSILAQRSRTLKIVTGEDGMIGLEGRAESDLLPEGKVFVRGELWDAWSPARIERGTPVRVTGVRGLRLEVSAVSADRMLESSVSRIFEDNDVQI